MPDLSRSLPRVVLSCCVATAMAAQQPPAGTAKTAHFEIRFRPGSRAEASVDRVAAVVEHDLARILGELGLTEFVGTIRLVLYDDVAELQRVTGVPSAGHSVPLCSHVPHDNDQTRVHELVHVVAERFREKGTETRNLFFAEGLANAVLRFVDGVHVDQVAAFHRRRGDLPAMTALHELKDFYAWLQQHPLVGAYDVAGSWMRFLLDVHGPDKVRRYYRGVSAADAFGKDVEALERDWHARLDAVVLRDGTRRLLQQRLGRTAAERDPDAVAIAAVLEPASAWRALAPPPARDRAGEAAGEAEWWLGGSPTSGDWCELPIADCAGDTIVRCTAIPVAGCYGVKVQLGPDCQAIVLRGQGAFLYCKARASAHERSTALGERVQIVLRRRGDRACVWVDGALVLEGAVDPAAARIALGSVGGPARFRDVAVRGP